MNNNAVNKKFPDFFPENCPPGDAIEKEIQAYRICKSNPASHSDFLSFYEEGKSSGNSIKQYGVSVFSKLNEIKEVVKMPIHRNAYIAMGITSSECGVIKHTPSFKNPMSSHHTWWLYEGAKPENYFTIMEENDGE